MSEAPSIPLPPLDEPEGAPFWEGARQNRLLVPTCAHCGFVKWPPRSFCSQCRKAGSEWREMSGRGRLWSWALAHNPTLPAFWPFVPFPIVLVELDDAPQVRMAGNVIAAPGAAINSLKPEHLRIGMPLRVTFEALSGEVSLPRWVPAEGGS